MLLGDVGGLQDGLILLARYFISFFATFAIKSKLFFHADKHNLVNFKSMKESNKVEVEKKTNKVTVGSFKASASFKGNT